MKKIITLFIAATILLTAAGCAKESEIPSGFKLASNEVCDFDFMVPETWTVSLSEGTVAAYCSPTDPSSISVMPGELENTDTTVEDWWEAHKADFESVYDEFTLLSEEEATLGGVTGKCYTFTGKLGENTYRFEITAVVLRSRLYMMTFTSTEDKYEDHEDTLALVKEHFAFTQ